MSNDAAIAAVKAMARSLRELSAVPSQAASEAADEIASLIEDQFDSGTDPYGEPWASLAVGTMARGRTPPPLTDSGDMRDGVEVSPASGAGITVTFDSDYTAFHQAGTRFMPQRLLLPDGRGLPDTWRRAIADAMEGAFDRAMGR